MPDAAENPAALKEIFNRARLEHIATEAVAVYPGFGAEKFLALATDNLAALGIMERMRQTARALHPALPGGYRRNLDILAALAPRIGHGFAAIVLSEYVAQFGLDDAESSLPALKVFTRYGSSEFAIRAFLQRDFDKTLAVMTGWAGDDNEHVRRLASEGSRPRLPWSVQLRPLLADPSLTAPILETLRADPSLYVRKSVANHLNDITKDHPDWVLQRFEGWPRDNAHTSWIMRHALRTLIKRGDPRALALVGASDTPEIEVGDYVLAPARLLLGEVLTLSVRLVSTAAVEQRLVVDYAVHYVRRGDTPARKVFKLRTLTLAPGAAAALSIRQTIRDFSTRRHYAGRHRVELIVNGQTLAEADFELVV